MLSKQEVWQMLSGCKLLKHKILIGILYGCGLRCMEVRNLRLCDLDFGRKQLKVVQGKGKRPLFTTFRTSDSWAQKSISKRKNRKIISLENLVEGVLVAISIPVTPSAAFSGR